jgi:hypothetical protein
MKKRNKFWALTMALVLTGGSTGRMQRVLSKRLRTNPELVFKILEENPEDFVWVTQTLMKDEMEKKAIA